MYVYFGHGSGEQYLPLAAMRRLTSSAASLLMGCSSGRLRQLGSYDPAGAVIGYLLAGGLGVVLVGQVRCLCGGDSKRWGHCF